MRDNHLSKRPYLHVSIFVGLFLSLNLGVVLYLLTTEKCVTEKLGLISYVVIFFSVAIPAFLINLILPVSFSRWRAIIVAIPSLFVLFIFFSVKTYYEYLNVPENKRDIWFLIRVSCCIGPIITFGTSVFTAFAGWLGSQLNFRIKQTKQSKM
jgi:ABC-type glycerol-3-phosphate transport system permease component